MKKMDKKRQAVNTKISFHPEMEGIVSDFQRDCIEEEINSLPPIKDKEVEVDTDFIFDLGDKYEASIFIRNGLIKPLNLENIPLIVVNQNQEILGTKMFNLREMGEIPARSVRPWKIYFQKEELNVGENDITDLKIIFDPRLKAEKTLKVEFENLPKGIQGEHKRKYDKILEELPLLRHGQVSMSAYDVYKTEDGKVSAEVVIRNARNRGVKVQKVPMSIFDAKNNLVASGIFYLKDVSISPYRAKVYSFSFSQEELLRKKIDLSSWNVDFKVTKNI